MTDAPADSDGPLAPAERPPWLFPVAFGVLAVAVIVIAAIAVRSGDDSASTPTSIDSVAATTSTSTVPSSTSSPAGTTEPTSVPATVAEPDTTDPEPDATSTTTTTAAPGPGLADELAALGPGEASIADGEIVERYQLLSTCTVQQTIGLQVTSSLLIGDNGSIRTLDILSDEGSRPSARIYDVGGQVPGFVFGRDGGDGAQRIWGDAAVASAFEPVDRMQLEPINGVDTGINLSYQPRTAESVCTSARQSPWLDVDEFSSGTERAVLGVCDVDGVLLTGAGGLLRTAIDNQLVLFAELVFTNDAGQPEQWLSPEPLEAIDQTVSAGNDGLVGSVRIVRTSDGEENLLEWSRLFNAPVIACG